MPLERVEKTAAVAGAASCSASIVRRELEEIRIECGVDDQERATAEMQKLVADKWDVVSFGSPKLSPMKYSSLLVIGNGIITFAFGEGRRLIASVKADTAMGPEMRETSTSVSARLIRQPTADPPSTPLAHDTGN